MLRFATMQAMPCQSHWVGEGIEFQLASYRCLLQANSFKRFNFEELESAV